MAERQSNQPVRRLKKLRMLPSTGRMVRVAFIKKPNKGIFFNFNIVMQILTHVHEFKKIIGTKPLVVNTD